MVRVLRVSRETVRYSCSKLKKKMVKGIKSQDISKKFYFQQMYRQTDMVHI